MGSDLVAEGLQCKSSESWDTTAASLYLVIDRESPAHFFCVFGGRCSRASWCNITFLKKTACCPAVQCANMCLTLGLFVSLLLKAGDKAMYD